MLIQEQFNKLTLQQIQIEQEIQQCSLLLNKQKKLFWTFHKELKSLVNAIPLSTRYSFNFYQYKMTQYNSLNVKLSNSQLNELKCAIKNETEVVSRLSSNMIGNNKTNFPHKCLLTDRQVLSFRKSFASHSSANIKLSKTQ